MERGYLLNEVEDKSEHLRTYAKGFEKKAREAKWQLWFQRAVVPVTAISILGLLIYFFVF